MNTPEKSTVNEWHNCQPGDVGVLVRNLKQETRRRDILRASLPVGLAACLLVGVGLFANSIPREPNYGGIVCSKVIEFGESYVLGLLNEVEAAKIALHLEKCEPCRDHMDDIRQELSASLDSKDREQVTLHADHHREFMSVPIIAQVQ